MRKSFVFAAVLAFGITASPAPGLGTETLQIVVLSTRADIVSGGGALVEIVVPPAAGESDVRADLDGVDVTNVFAVRDDGRFYGLVTGLALGANVLTARLPDGSGAQITLTNHPIQGPVFSGPHIKPWTCASGALDEHCNRAPTYEWHYKPQDSSGLSSYDPSDPPDDVDTTTTDQGNEVPFIVREETGVIARDQYRIAILFDPQKPWAPWAPQKGWNNKLVITHGASCNTGYAQASAPDVLNQTALSRGFAVMSHALNNSGHNCNVVTQAEAMIMTKEHLVETYGEIRYTIGSGCSGGALAQYQTANAYPGLYQGITPACSFMDTWTGRMLYEDYSLLRRYFEDPSRWDPGNAWTEDQIAAVWGHPNHVNAIVYNTAIAPLLDPSRSCPGVPAAQVYNAQSNPGGVRCSLQDYMVNVFGKRAQDGFARRPWDNTGVQYGFRALMNGKITRSQFIDVNAKVGGRDIDYEWQPQRAVADLPALEAAHRSGAYNTASNLDQVAIIDLRGPDPGAFHDVYRTYALRARLEREHGHADNMLMWRGPVALFGDATFADESILAMDRWLAAVEADTSDRPLAEKIVADRPADVDHRCTNGAGTDIGSDAVCNAIVESYSTARIQAGMPFTDDVAKCQLRPLHRSLYYPLQFTDAEWARLEAAFPDGVCDYGKPAVHYQKTVPWQSYRDGPGGAPLGDPPASIPL